MTRKIPRKEIVKVLRQAEGALLDYVERLEKNPMTTLGYGRWVLAQVRKILDVEDAA